MKTPLIWPRAPCADVVAPDRGCHHLGGGGYRDTATSGACGSATYKPQARSKTRMFVSHCVFPVRVSRARLQQVDQGGDVRDVAEVVDHMQAFFDLPVT